jgi:hypothetical protein
VCVCSRSFERRQSHPICLLAALPDPHETWLPRPAVASAADFAGCVAENLGLDGAAVARAAGRAAGVEMAGQAVDSPPEPEPEPEQERATEPAPEAEPEPEPEPEEAPEPDKSQTGLTASVVVTSDPLSLFAAESKEAAQGMAAKVCPGTWRCVSGRARGCVCVCVCSLCVGVKELLEWRGMS